VAFSVAVLSGACGVVPENPGQSTEQTSDVTCSQIDDQTYTSVVDHPIGQQCGSSNGAYLCTPYNGSWLISFDKDSKTAFWARGNGDDPDSGRSIESIQGKYTCSKSGLVFGGEFQSADMSLQALVKDSTTIYVGNAHDTHVPLQSRENQYELN